VPARPAVGEGLEVERGSVTVCIPVGPTDESPATQERLAATFASVVEHTDPLVSLLIAGPATQVKRVLETPPGSRDWPKDLHALELSPDSSGTEAVNAAIEASFPGDVVLVTGGVEVTNDWLPRLRAAAFSDSTVATATPLSLGVGGVDLFDDPELLSALQTESPGMSRPTPERAKKVSADGPDTPPSISGLAQKVAEHSRRLRPRIATIGPGCAYIRRQALELLGPPQESLTLEEALFDLAIRAISAGMVHVAADDVLVAGRRNQTLTAPARAPAVQGPTAQGSAAQEPQALGIAEQVRETVADDEHGRLRRAMDIACTVLRPPSVTIDGRSLTSTVGGTQTYILELITALAQSGGVSLRVLIPHDLSERAQSVLGALSGVELVGYEQALEGVSLSDVVHRPQQAFTPSDMALLRLVGRRIVIGQQDLIAYHNHSYHPDADRWRAYRRTTRLALAAADQVIFFSEHARRDALAEDLLPVGRTHMVSVGADPAEAIDAPEAQPAGVSSDREFLFCIGADYAHKNRPFAIELTGALNELGWRGGLVFVGGHVDHGSSREREREVLERHPNLANRVVDLGPVDEPSKRWLYRHARALVYPTLYEGFGLVPLEAARARLPCLFAPQASLSELAGQAATLRPWDARASAVAVLALLVDGPERERHLEQLRSLGLPSWEDVAKQLAEVYERAISEPPSEAADRAWQELGRESCIVRLDRDVQELKAKAQEYQDAYHSLSTRVAGGLPLIDEGGLLSPAEQRGIMRIASRRLLRAPILGPMGILGRVSSSRDSE
jgi:glycosyltransferase involved in cell wall biosynthesis